MATITGTFNSLVSGTISGVFNNTAGGVLSGIVGTPGPRGLTGATGPAGPAGPAPVWGNITGTLSAQTDLSTALAGKYSTTNPAGYIDLTTAGLYFYPLTGNPGGFATQAWVIGQNYLTASSLDSYATQSWVNTQLAGYALQSWVTDHAYPLTGNPSGFLTSSALTPYLLSSTAASTYAVIAAGQPTSGTVGQVLTKNSGSSYDSSWQTIIPGDRYLTTSSTSNAVSNGAKTFTVSTGLSYTTQQDVTIAYDATHHMHAVVTSYDSGTGVLVVDVQQHTGSGTFTSWTVNVGGTVPLQSVAWGDITGTLGSQTDLATALNDKLEVTTAASTYYLQTNPSGFIGDAPSNGSQYARKNGAWDVVSSSGGTWGSITGTITSQTDLVSYVENQTNAYALRDATARDYSTSLDAFPITLASTGGLYSVDLQINNIGYQGIAINFSGGSGYYFTNYGTYLQFDYNFSDDVGTIVSNLNGLGSGFAFTFNDYSGTGPYYNSLSNIASLDRTITDISSLTNQEVMFKSELDSYLIDDAVSKGMTSAWSQYAPLISVSGSGAAVSYGKPWESWAYSISATDSLLTAKASLSGATFTGLLITKASAAGGAGFRLTSGVAPTTPQTGDFWFDGTNLKAGLGGGTTGTLPFLSTGNTWTGVNNFGASTGIFAGGTGGGAISIGSGATTTGLTKTLNLGINGAAGSTTNVVVGSTTGTSTTTLQGTTNGVTATALDSSTKLATTAFVRGDNNVKSRVTFTGTGTVTIRSSFNVSSITDNGVGDYRVNFTTAIADANYSVSGSANDSTAGSTYLWLATGSATNADISRLTTSVRVQTIYGTALKLDASTVDVIVSR